MYTVSHTDQTYKGKPPPVIVGFWYRFWGSSFMTVDQKAQVANAREEQQMSNENDEQNRAEVDCPRCDGCGQLADSDDREPWSVWMALPVGSALAVTMGLAKPEPCDECGGTGKVAGEHHTGTLDLTGEGNAPEFTVEALHDEICRTYGAIWSPDNLAEVLARHGWVQTGASRRMTLDAMRLIADTRKLVAEEIAAALEAEARGDYDAADDLRWAAAKAREIGGVA